MAGGAPLGRGYRTRRRGGRLSLWDDAARAYAAPGVEATCLALQDDHGQCFPLLLWAAWARPADPDVVARAVAMARAWTSAAITPLRHARRALKADQPGIAADQRQALRSRIKSAELEAEKLLLHALEALVPAATGDLADALASCAAAWGDPPPPGDLLRLAEALRGAARL